jgi:hypothetical protein
MDEVQKPRNSECYRFVLYYTGLPLHIYLLDHTFYSTETEIISKFYSVAQKNVPISNLENCLKEVRMLSPKGNLERTFYPFKGSESQATVLQQSLHLKATFLFVLRSNTEIEEFQEH